MRAIAWLVVAFVVIEPGLYGAEAPNVPLLLIYAAHKYHLPIGILAHRAWRESKFDPNVPPNKGCYGVMQLNALYFPGAAMMTVAENIDAGAEYLARLYRRCGGDWVCAERAYRTGKVRHDP
jgi:soluble lytic murein transglycosylase-like protein